MIPDIACTWNGDSFVPGKQFRPLCNQHFVCGQTYVAEFTEERSMRNHRHYFADLKNAWLNLPEAHSERFPTPEHLRAAALIETGWRDEFRFMCGTGRDAAMAAAACTRGNQFAAVSITDRAAVVWIPKSQARNAMSNADFKASKQAVLDWCWTMIGLKPIYEGAGDE